MPAFEYVALDKNGAQKKGVIEGDAPRQARQQLRDKGLMPITVEEVSRGGSKTAKGERPTKRSGRGMAAGDLAVMTRQLSTLVQSATPIADALRTVGLQSEKAHTKSVLAALRSRVVEGHPLASALGDFPRVFPELYRATVAAGEQSGKLDNVLDRLADYTESRQGMLQKISLALVYPILLIGLSIIIVSGLLAFVVPEVVAVFTDTKQPLPLITVVVIALSDFIRAWGWLLLIGITTATVVIRALWQRDALRHKMQRQLMRLPLLGRLLVTLNTARFARTLSILAGSGVPVLEALRIAGEVVTLLPMRQAIKQAADRVREGAAISAALSRSRLFPPVTLHLVASGESSGTLEDMLERAAVQQERELDTAVSRFLTLLEPMLILVMGVVVLLIVLAILLPVFELNQLVEY